MNCHKCGAELEENANFCKKCGSKVSFDQNISEEKQPETPENGAENIKPAACETTPPLCGKDLKIKLTSTKNSKLNPVLVKVLIVAICAAAVAAISFGIYFYKTSSLTSEQKLSGNLNVTADDLAIYLGATDGTIQNPISGIAAGRYMCVTGVNGNQTLDEAVNEYVGEKVSDYIDELESRAPSATPGTYYYDSEEVNINWKNAYDEEVWKANREGENFDKKLEAYFTPRNPVSIVETVDVKVADDWRERFSNNLFNYVMGRPMKDAFSSMRVEESLYNVLKKICKNGMKGYQFRLYRDAFDFENGGSLTTGEAKKQELFTVRKQKIFEGYSDIKLTDDAPEETVKIEVYLDYSYTARLSEDYDDTPWSYTAYMYVNDKPTNLDKLSDLYYAKYKEIL
ncbi:MAG: zinc ribbon domain-containing protein [Synergistes sp.]|nr:zinc ribbon domain-containing protein [Synergistes sp.]